MSLNQDRQQAILVLGMHRSGTSAATRVLNLLGAELNKEMLDVSADNPKGFWESAEAVELHERLFKALSRTWYDMHALPPDWMSYPVVREAVAEIADLVRRDFDGKALWAIKDPRMCLLVPLWLEALQSLDIDVKSLFVVRNPIEVSESLRVRHTRERNQWGLGHAPLMWAQYLAEAEIATRHSPRAMITYDELLLDWRTTMGRVADDLGVAWPNGLDEVGDEIDAFLDRGDRHHAAEFDPSKATRLGVPNLVVRQYQECLRITRQRTAWTGLMPLSDEFRLAENLYAGALANVLRFYDDADTRAVRGENAMASSAAEIAGYQEQAQKYDCLLRIELSRVEVLHATLAAQADAAAAQHAAYERELDAYRKQAETYDRLLRESMARADRLAGRVQGHADVAPMSEEVPDESTGKSDAD